MKQGAITIVGGREKIKQLKGRKNIQMSCTYVNDLNDEIYVALAAISNDLCSSATRHELR